jgi:GT2 family glycosyltransferase
LLRIVALITVHNRREKTLRALTSLFEASTNPAIHLSAVVLDDGSTDGTAAAVTAAFDRVTVIHGDGSYYWARGMKVAEEAALRSTVDFLLWLNDDVQLDAGAVDRMLAVHYDWKVRGAVIVAGAMRSASGSTTYGGLWRQGRHPLRYSLAEPGAGPQLVDAANGNAVLIPASVIREIGGIDGTFAHAYADIDFTLRARSRGVAVVMANGHVGVCERNPAPPWLRGELPASERWRAFLGPKGLPPRSLARFMRRHGGVGWPFFFASPYVSMVVRSLRSSRVVSYRPCK